MPRLILFLIGMGIALKKEIEKSPSHIFVWEGLAWIVLFIGKEQFAQGDSVIEFFRISNDVPEIDFVRLS